MALKGLRGLAGGIALAVVMAGTAAQAAVISTFDTDADGWTPFQNAGSSVVYSATGGNPDGHISIDDVSADWAYLQAPSKFLAPAAYGGALSFDLRHFNGSPTAFPTLYKVRVGLEGAGFSLIAEATVPTTAWTSYLFELTEVAGWRLFSNLSQNYSSGAPAPTAAQMQDILANLTRLVIATDYSDACIACSGAIDRTYIDNVSIDTAVPPVPLPAALPMLVAGTGLLGVIGWRRRRKAA